MSKAKRNKNLELVVDNTEEKKTLWNPDALPGGKDPTEDWLSKLPEGTIFACKPRQDTSPMCLEYEILFKYEKCVRLFTTNMNPNQIIVTSKKFSSMFDLIEVLTQVQKEEE